MGWSNSLPPQIQTLPDGSTQFAGPIVVSGTDGSTVASIGQDGSVNGKVGNYQSINLKGADLQNTLDHTNKGVFNYGVLKGDTFPVSTGTGVVLVLAPFTPDSSRNYKISCNSAVLIGNTPGDQWALRVVTYSAYPTAANVSSYGILCDSYQTMPGGNIISSPHMEWKGQLPTNQIWIALVLIRVAGTGTCYIHPTASIVELAIEDIGSSNLVANSTYNPIPYSGGTAPPPPPQNYNKGYVAQWSRSFNVDGSVYANNGVETNHVYQGNDQNSFHGNTYSYVNFPYSSIQADLAGATTLTGAQINIYCEHTWYSGGASLEMYGIQINSTSPTGSMGVGSFIGEVHAPNPGWIQIALSTGNIQKFQNGTFTGIAFYVNSADPTYYAYLGGATEGNFGPNINFQYTK